MNTTENPTPHDTVREKKSTALRKRTAYPKSLTLPSEEHPPRKRIRSNAVAAHLDCSIQGTSKPSTLIGIKCFGAHPVLLDQSLCIVTHDVQDSINIVTPVQDSINL